jgi:type II secretory pathway component PulF
VSARFAYAYRGLRGARPIRGTVYAGTRVQARARLRRMNVSAPELRLAPLATVAAAVAPGFDALDLENFYVYLGRVIEKGLPRPQLIADAVEFAQDPHLRFALAMVRDAVSDGATLTAALRGAGFPERDCQLLAAGEASGRLQPVLVAMAREVRREGELRRNLRRILMPPLLVGAAAYVLAYLALVLLAPMIAHKFAENAALIRLPDYARAYYVLVEAFNRHLVAGSVAYAAAGLALVLLARSALARAVVERAFPTLARLHELAEMAQLWGAFALMTDSGMAKVEVANQLARAALRVRTRERFRRLERQLKLGAALDVGVERASFPRYIVAGVRSATAANAIGDGTRDLAERLSIQVQILTTRINAIVSGLSALAGALMVLGFAAVTVLPQMTAVLANF